MRCGKGLLHATPTAKRPACLIDQLRVHFMIDSQACVSAFQQCSFVEHRDYKVVYRRYASLFFLVGLDAEEVRLPCTVAGAIAQRASKQLELRPCCDLTGLLAGRKLQNELALLEFIHCLVETLDRHFGNVCELDIMFHLETVRNHQ